MPSKRRGLGWGMVLGLLLAAGAIAAGAITYLTLRSPEEPPTAAATPEIHPGETPRDVEPEPDEPSEHAADTADADDHNRPSDDQLTSTVQSDLRIAASQMEDYFRTHSLYAESWEVLRQFGARTSEGVTITVFVYDSRQTYCLEGSHEDLGGVWAYDPRQDGLLAEGMSCPPAVVASGPEVVGSVWIVVIRSMEVERYSRSDAEEAAEDFRQYGIVASVLLSNDYGSLNPGYWVVYTGWYETSEAAASRCRDIRLFAPDCYQRELHR